MVLVAQKPKREKTHQKKRDGRHHNTSAKHYRKHYWPYLPLLAIVALGFAVNAMWGPAIAQVLGDHTRTSVRSLLIDTNQQRISHNEAKLSLSPRLINAAQAKANDMAARNYWSHNTPDGRTPWWFIKSSGYQYAAAGENLAYGFKTSSATLNGWMHSPEHRANILNTAYRNVGFGIARAPHYQGRGAKTIVVAMYAEPISALVDTSARPGNLPQRPSPHVAEQAAPVSRATTLAPSGVPWSLFVVLVITAVAATVFIVRHLYFWQRVLVHGEHWIIKHRLLDVAIVAIATLGVLLTQTAGFIH
jgi:hypothetical protein